MSVEAIQTEYGGNLYRSRLEARWAYFFDLTGIKYQYETEGFQTGSGLRYLPDFYLPEHDAYVEVKGSLEQYHKDLGNKLIPFLEEKNSPIQRLVILGNIPYSEEANGVYWYPVLYYHPLKYGVWREYKPLLWLDEDSNALFEIDWGTVHTSEEPFLGSCPVWENPNADKPAYTGTIKHQKLDPLPDEAIEPVASDEDWGTFRERFASSKLIQAYKLARYARFEYGETPANVKKL